MAKIWQRSHGMTLAGQGTKILLFILPFLLAAFAIQIYFPKVAALPGGRNILPIIGLIWLIPGLALWGTGIVQLILGFSKGQLVTTGAYGIVRNPLYSSVTFFVFPAVSLISCTWVYFVVAAALYTGVRLFIGKEEQQLTAAFGKNYEDYLHRVPRLVPFLKPHHPNR